MLGIFRELSTRIGREKVIWRYDPIAFTDKYTAEYHIKAFREIAEALQDHTVNLVNLQGSDFNYFVSELSAIAKGHGMKIAACAEEMDLVPYGIGHNCCIDKELIEKLTGSKISVKKDKNQREECGCVESVEIGTYNTCRNACKYCYANYSGEKVNSNCQNYDPLSPL